MKDDKKVSHILQLYLQWPVFLTALVILAGAAVNLISRKAGFVMLAFTVIYAACAGTLYMYGKKRALGSLVSFASAYSWSQKQLLASLELPYAIADTDGKILWMNRAFEAVTKEEKSAGKSLTMLFKEITVESLEKMENAMEVHVIYGESKYRVSMKRVTIRPDELASGIPEKQTEQQILAVYLYDETELYNYKQAITDQKMVAGLIYLDNYEEALESVEEVRRSLLIALIDRKVNKYIASLDGISKKLEKDKYLVIMRKKAVAQLQENRFDLLEEVKTVNIGNEMAVTISIGIGLDGLTYAQNYEVARTAIDLALGRGGDQAVIKTPESITYYGGKSQQVEKNTRVKARVNAHALREIITGKDRVIVMGHRMPDVDSFGSAVGIYRIAQTLGRKAHIVLNEATTSVQPLVELFKNNPEYDEDMIITSQQAIDMAGSNTVLVVVDVNKPSITECPDLLRFCKSVVVLDHHRQGTETIENATLSYVEPYASSACEMVSEILQYTYDNIKIRTEEADCMYSGIMIDTNNFMTKTGVRTFEAAAFLRRNGADVTRVRKLFREDAAEYKAKADAVSQAEIYKQFFAISLCTAEDLPSPTIIGAQAANELLNIKGIKASFVLTDYQGKIYVSARSIDEVNVQIIMERMGGGGHMNTAACQMEGVGLVEAIGVLKNTIDDMLESGEI